MPPSLLFLSVALRLSAAVSSCGPLPLPEAVSRAAIILHGRVERVVYLGPDGAAETPPRQDGRLCGPKLVTFTVTRLLKGVAADSVTAFAEDGCLYLGGYFREGEEYVAFTFPLSDGLGGAVASQYPVRAATTPVPIATVLHVCGGTKRVGAANGGDLTAKGADAYMADITALLRAAPVSR